MLDSAILIRAFLPAAGLARDLLTILIRDKHTLVVSSPILFEVAKVLRYPRLLELHGFGEHDIYQYVGYLREVAVALPLDTVIPVPIRDVNDVMVAHTAIVGEVEYLCTTDRDFFDEKTMSFLARFGITVLTDVGLIHRLRSMPV